MSLRVGIDIGTSGVRAAAIDPQDHVVATARAPHLPQDPQLIDAEKWWDATQACIRALVDALASEGRSGQEVTGLAVDGTSGTMLLTDAGIRPVTPALMYNSKGFEVEAARIARVAPPTHITQGANSALGRAMRLVSVSEGTPRYLMHQADFIAAKLTGRPGFSDQNNALKTGFDPGAGTWPDWMGEVLDPALLPRCLPVGTPISSICREAAQISGLSPATVVYAGTTDSIAAFLASAPLEVGIAVTSLGSTLAVKVLSDMRIDDPAIGLYSHRVKDIWLAGGASNTGGAVLAHYFTGEELNTLSAKIDTSYAAGLNYYPLLSAGERFPINDPNLAPNLSPRPSEDHLFLQGMLEAMARIEAQCYRAIEERGGPFPKTVLTAGGGAKNEKWTALRAGALGQTPRVAAEPEASVGVAKLATG
ncbi:MAG: FGGY-family carbohydrate kinase [Dinoroseobacter sp.]|nr:FGGY-family carbohydrate kinase [Dinoroseobacter sp.]